MAVTGLALGACSDTASQLLTTGSILGGSAKPAAAKVETPVDRALQVAAVSARAQKCGYVFDPAGLRGAFLAGEATRPNPPADMTGLAARYDYAAREVANRISADDAYCTPDRTKFIKSDLNRYLAGDFGVRTRRVARQRSIFDASDTRKELNPNWGRDSSEELQRTVEN